MAILIIADHEGGQLSETTAKVLTAAKAIGGDIDILIGGEGVDAAASQAAALARYS